MEDKRSWSFLAAVLLLLRLCSCCCGARNTDPKSADASAYELSETVARTSDVSKNPAATVPVPRYGSALTSAKHEPHTATTPPSTSGHVSRTTSRTTRGSRFDAGSFIGGMILALAVTLALAVGYRLACSRRDVGYRTLGEQDALI
ncbi:porimin [Denticeps clupeoides]|uniref:porimin n=1 Tax=Denticeps clupeoides TaxID=299321 RepID=UPI0010A355B3|nr:porimin [Denticeps clupeoides]